MQQSPASSERIRLLSNPTKTYDTRPKNFGHGQFHPKGSIRLDLPYINQAAPPSAGGFAAADDGAVPRGPAPDLPTVSPLPVTGRRHLGPFSDPVEKIIPFGR